MVNTDQMLETAQPAEKKVNAARQAVLSHIGEAIAQLNALTQPYKFLEEDINDLARVARRVATIPLFEN